MNFKETQTRSIVKTIVCRIFFTISVVSNMYIAGATWYQILVMLPVGASVNSFLYWAHERIWNYFQWNRKPRNDFWFYEGQPRTLAKSVTWRITISMSNLFLPYFITGSWGTAAIYFTLATVVNATIFYVNERVWNRIAWGKVIN